MLLNWLSVLTTFKLEQHNTLGGSAGLVHSSLLSYLSTLFGEKVILQGLLNSEMLSKLNR